MADTCDRTVVGDTKRRSAISAVVDLSELGSLDAGGLRALVEAREQLVNSGRVMTVTGARGEVMAVIRSSGLDGAVPEAPKPREHRRQHSVRD